MQRKEDLNLTEEQKAKFFKFLDVNEVGSYPRFAQKQGIQVPNDFWNFWRLYYASNESGREVIKVNNNYATYKDLLWRIFDLTRSHNGSVQK